MENFVHRLRGWLEDAQRDRRLVGVHRWNDDPDIFVVGFVRAVSKECAEFEWVDPSGQFDEDDPVSEVMLDAIAMMDIGTRYLKKLEHLVSLRPDKPSAASTVKGRARVRTAVAAAAASGECVTIKLVAQEDATTAFVREAA